MVTFISLARSLSRLRFALSFAPTGNFLVAVRGWHIV